MAEPFSFLLLPGDAPAKRRILVAALELFAARGVDGVSIRDIGEAAGFTNPALFRHFAGKDALAQALFDACYRRLVAALTGPSARHPATLPGRFAACIDLIAEAPQSVHFVLDNLRRYWPTAAPDLRAQSMVGAMRGLVLAEQAEGRVRPEADSQLIVVLLLGTLSQVARMAQFDDSPAPPDTLAAGLWRILERGVGG